MDSNHRAGVALASLLWVAGLGAAAAHADPRAKEAAPSGPRFLAPGESDAGEVPPFEDENPAPQEQTQETAPAVSGRAAVMQASFKSKTANDEAAYSEIIDLCQRGMQGELKPTLAAYAKKLSGWAYNRRGQLLAEAGHDEAALADFEAAVHLDPKLWRAVHNRGVSYATLGKYREAIRDFERTLELKPDFSNAHFNRAELLYEQGNFAGAIKDYNEAVRLAPKDSAAYNSRGHAYYRMKRFREALQDYDQAIRLQPDNAAAYTNRGDIYSDMGQFGQAAKDYRTAIKVNPKLGRAYQSAAWLMATCPNAEYRSERLSVDAAKKAIELDGDDDYRYLDTLAAAQAATGHFDQARETELLAIRQAPQRAVASLEQRLDLYRRHQPFHEAPRGARAAQPAANVARRPMPPGRPSYRPRQTADPSMR